MRLTILALISLISTVLGSPFEGLDYLKPIDPKLTANRFCEATKHMSTHSNQRDSV
jgi:hypothetical protein